MGAGLAGLTLGLALSQRGIKTTIIEKEQLIEPSKWAILLYPQGMKIFDELGILEEITSLAMPLKAPEIETTEGEVLVNIDVGLLFEKRFNFSLGLGPSEIRKVLLRHCLTNGVEVMSGVRYVAAIRSPDGGPITGARVSKDGTELTISCSLLVGADGYNSKVRQDFGGKVVSKGYPPMVAFFIDGEHDLDRFRMRLGDGYMVVVLPCTKSKLMVAMTERGLLVEQLTGEGGETYVKRRMEEAAPFIAGAISTSQASLADGSMLLIDPQEKWTTAWVVDGGVLIGDAAHSFHPGVGQGAQQAFVDAMVLVPTIGDCLSAGDFSERRLASFERARGPYVRFAKSTFGRLVSMETAKGRFGVWLRNRFFRAVNRMYGKRSFQETAIGQRLPTRWESIRTVLALLF